MKSIIKPGKGPIGVALASGKKGDVIPVKLGFDQRDEAISLLRELEWCSSRRGPSTAMHLNNGYLHKACPVCLGVQPTLVARAEFNASALDHRPNCKLKRLIG